MRFIDICVSVLLLIATVTSATDYQSPPPTFDAKQFTVWDAPSDSDLLHGSRRAKIFVPFTDDAGNNDYVEILRVDLMGKKSYDRGVAHGYLLAKEIMEFMGPALNEYYRQIILSLDISQFPDAIQKILKLVEIKGVKAAPEIMSEALDYVWNKEEEFTPQYLKDEIDGVANGVCSSSFMHNKNCNITEVTQTIRRSNMLPELIRMACTAYGAWGDATPANINLVQMRALDFGTGPFANYTIVQVHRENENENPFVSISFAGMVGVITGISQSGIGVSEKVWMTYDKRNIQPGSYNGEADVFVLRDILQQSKTRVDAEKYLQQLPRTWAIWIGIGDYATQIFDLVEYKQDLVQVLTDKTAPEATGQPYIESIAYVDKHPQPSHDNPGTLPTALQDFYGNITLETSKVVTQYHETGDLHIASYDYTEKTLYLSIGRINKKGDYCPDDGADSSIWKAYNRPYLRFDLTDLWAGN